MKKNCMSNLLLVVILILESKGLYFLKRTQHQAKKNYMYHVPSGVNITYDTLNITAVPLGQVLTKIPFNAFSSRKK